MRGLYHWLVNIISSLYVTMCMIYCTSPRLILMDLLNDCSHTIGSKCVKSFFALIKLLSMRIIIIIIIFILRNIVRQYLLNEAIIAF